MLDIGGSHGYWSVALCRRHLELPLSSRTDDPDQPKIGGNYQTLPRERPRSGGGDGRPCRNRTRTPAEAVTKDTPSEPRLGAPSRVSGSVRPQPHVGQHLVGDLLEEALGITAEDTDRLTAACRTPTERLVIWTSLDTGLRVGDRRHIKSGWTNSQGPFSPWASTPAKRANREPNREGGPIGIFNSLRPGRGAGLKRFITPDFKSV
jgi:hypothetical protein